MANIAVVTDSTAYLPKELLDKYQIRTVCLRIHWEDETYLDGIDITPEEFYDRLVKSDTIPTTSQTPVFDFLQIFEELAENHEGIIVPLISSGISGTVASALAAKEEFNKIPVEIIDTKTTAGGLAMITLAAARAVEQGASFDEAVRIARQVADNIELNFFVDTLEFLHKGGRIGGASRYFGTALQIKPILHLDKEGKIDALERVRTKSKALKRLISLTQENANGSKVNVSVMHAVSPDEAEKIRQQLESLLDCQEIFVTELSPVIGTHSGPGVIAVAVYPIQE